MSCSNLERFASRRGEGAGGRLSIGSQTWHGCLSVKFSVAKFDGEGVVVVFFTYGCQGRTIGCSQVSVPEERTSSRDAPLVRESVPFGQFFCLSFAGILGFAFFTLLLLLFTQGLNLLFQLSTMLPFFLRFLLFDLQLFRFVDFLFSETTPNSLSSLATETRSLPVVELGCYRLVCTETWPSIRWDRSDDVLQSPPGHGREQVLKRTEAR